MFLKKYQVKVVSELKAFYGKSRETKDAFDTARKALPAEIRHTLNWVQTTFQTAAKEYKDRIDEIHKVFSDMARKTIDGLNPEMVLGLTATPKTEMNVLVTITGLELKDEDMVKLDMHIIPPSGRKEDDWKSMLREIKAHRDTLEKKAITYRQNTGLYIRPIALLQVERTGKEQRGKGFVHSHDVKDFLQEMEIHPDEIAIKSSSQNDIEDVNLFAQVIDRLKSSFSEETKERRSIIVTLDAESKVAAKYEHSEVNGMNERNQY